MGSSEQPRPDQLEDDEEVDLDADTKESTEEVFCNRDTVESPHKITLWYSTDISKKIVKHLPAAVLRRPIGEEIKFGRHRTADVLLNEEHMAREFGTVTCRNNASNNAGFYLRNVSKQKRILFTDVNERKTEVLPTQEIELLEKTRIRLECVEFEIGIELGDTNSKTFEVEVRPIVKDISQTNGGLASSSGVGHASANIESAHIGLPVDANQRLNQNGNVDLTPRPQFYQGYGQATHPHSGLGAAYPATAVMSSPYHTGQAPYIMNNPVVGYGYTDQPATLFSQPYAMHPTSIGYHQQGPLPGQHPQLLERGGGYVPLGSSCPHHPEQGPHSQGLHMNVLSQTLPKIQPAIPQTGLSPRGIVANPSSQDQRPVLYPSPAYQRFRFPEPQAASQGSVSPDLTDLPRGPPLSRLSSTQSVDLHPAIPSNVVTTHAVTETAGTRNSKDPKLKMPIEHEDKPK